MRIIAGKFRGKKLTSPPDNAIRPTSDRVREALFSILNSRLGAGFEGLKVLDLFAGTGAFGLEALSRGAMLAAFVDIGVQARGIIRGHIENFGVGGQTKLLKRDATELGYVEKFEPFDLIFIDPPYAKGMGEKALEAAKLGGWIAPDATLVLEEKRGVEINLPEGFRQIDVRHYGDTSVYILELDQIN
ncbi:MAG TPA: 16S rRNA (guanine(966)-N(2))-methyltransferase RsmD [Devosia sp.]|nr:16S rRNA (guanine(966)-N(2))-methyltransferase RsmD [Devosia sp.]